jgi:uncharacterized protein YeaO (DUF488 family)
MIAEVKSAITGLAFDMIRLKRVYSAPSGRDGLRVLVDRVWPRGVRKERARIALWLKETAPSVPLRKWFGHDPAKWKEFRRRYRRELKASSQGEMLIDLARQARRRTVTLLYGAVDEQHNQAVVLKEWLEQYKAPNKAVRSHRKSSSVAPR